MSKQIIYLISFLFVLGVALTSTANAEDPSLVGWWTFDEDLGTIAKDYSGNGNDATLLGEPTWSTDPEHKGILLFDGDDDHAYIEGTPFELPNYTIALWFRVDGGSGSRDILSAKGPSGVNGVLLEIQGAGTLRNLHRFPFAQGGGSNIYTDASYDDGSWHHVAAVKTASEMILYVDGQQVGSEPDSSQFEGPLGEIWLGTLDQRMQRMFLGAIDDLRIYNRVLSEQEIQTIMEGEVDPLAYAPQPKNGAVHEDTWANLKWGPGDFAVSHNVYFGDNYDDVNAGAESTFQGNQSAASLIVGFLGFAYPDGLVHGTTYYWRIDEVNDTDPNSPWKGNIWSFLVPSKTAYKPDPPDGAKFIDLNVELSWTGGFRSKLHTLYFGDNFDDVNNATGGLPEGKTAYTPGTLELEKTCYWRVDEFDGTSTYKGDVWSFTTTAPGGGLKGEYFNNINLIGNPVLTRIDPGVDFNWADSPEPNAVNADNFSMRWRGEIEVAFSEAYRFYAVTEDGVKLWINDQLVIDRWDVFRMNEYRTDRIELQAGQRCAIEMWSYNDDAGATAQLLWESEHQPKGIIPAAAFSPPVRAGSPKPASGAVNVSHTTVLEWLAGDHAAEHNVYFSTDEEAVRNANTDSPEYKGTNVLGSESYDPGKLPWDTTYYWRVNEVNNLNPESPWVGNVWSFTTADFLGIEDFEDYNDWEPDRIFETWIDGWGVETNGSEVGYAEPNFPAGEHHVETTIVHGGYQSMPYFYENNFKYSEATMTLVSARDWTKEGVGVLSLWFYGDASNTAERMYVALNGIAVVYHDNPDAALIEEWMEWTIDLSAPGGFAAQGVNLANVNTITIGFGDKNNLQAGGSGMVLFDDIRLYRPAEPEPEPAP